MNFKRNFKIKMINISTSESVPKINITENGKKNENDKENNITSIIPSSTQVDRPSYSQKHSLDYLYVTVLERDLNACNNREKYMY